MIELRLTPTEALELLRMLNIALVDYEAEKRRGYPISVADCERQQELIRKWIHRLSQMETTESEGER